MNKAVKLVEADIKLPLYRQVANSIRDDILNGNIGIGERLLAESKLAASFNVGLVTAQKALKILNLENLIERSPRGTFVSSEALQMLETRNIGLLMFGLSKELTMSQSPSHWELFDGMQKFCFENSWNLQIIHTQNKFFSWNSIRNLNLSGLLLVFPRTYNYELIAELKRQKVNFACINIFSEKIAKQVNYINIDYYGTSVKAVQDLFSQGKRNIALLQIGSPSESSYRYQVLRGYKKAVKELKIENNIIKIKDSDNAQEKVKDYFHTQRDIIEKYDAIIAMRPEDAYTLHELTLELKFKQTQNISLFSFFANKDTRKANIPAFTHRPSSLGFESMNLLKKVMDNKNESLEHEQITLSLEH